MHNVVKKQYRFVVHYTDGREVERIIEAESRDAALLILQSELWEESQIDEIAPPQGD